MQMNAEYVGILDVYNQQDPEFMTGQTYLGLQGACGTEIRSMSQFGLYTADESEIYVPTAGYGGTSTPQPDGYSSGSRQHEGPANHDPGPLVRAWDNDCDGVTVPLPRPIPPMQPPMTSSGPYAKNGMSYNSGPGDIFQTDDQCAYAGPS